MVKILLPVNVGILIRYDASLKTDTCKVPESALGATYISRKCVVQAIPIKYPTSTKYLDAYRFPFIMVDGYTSSNYNDENKTFIVTSSTIALSSIPGSAADGNTYTDNKNPITCRYWYIDI